MKWFVIILLILLFSCGNEHSVQNGGNANSGNSLSHVKVDSGVHAATRDSILRSATSVPHVKVLLPVEKLKRSDIVRMLKEIDELKSGKSGEWETGDLVEGCMVEKYVLNGFVRYLRYGCGDCSPTMWTQEYYFDRDQLIYAENYTVHYSYPPCWSESEYAENSMSEAYRKKNKKEWTEQYWIIDSLLYELKRQGNFHDTAYVSEQPWILNNIRQMAEDHLNTASMK